MKTLCIGDIHCKLWIIDEVEKLIDEYDAVVFVGDYADDWDKDATDSLATWHKLYLLQKKYPDKVKLVLGNHDYIYVNRTPTLQSGYNMITQLAIDSPANKYLKNWLLSLPILLEVDGVTFSHAGIAEGWSAEQDVSSLWTDTSPLWVRPGMARYADIPQVFGHTPSETCYQVHKNIWCIDVFSTYSDGTPIGDQTVLQIIDGKKYKKIKVHENNNNPSGKSNRVL